MGPCCRFMVKCVFEIGSLWWRGTSERIVYASCTRERVEESQENSIFGSVRQIIGRFDEGVGSKNRKVSIFSRFDC